MPLTARTLSSLSAHTKSDAIHNFVAPFFALSLFYNLDGNTSLLQMLNGNLPQLR